MKHYDISYAGKEEPYNGHGFGKCNLPERGEEHVDRILSLYKAAIEKDKEALQLADVSKTRDGYYLKLRNAADYDLELGSIDSIKIGHIVSVSESRTDEGKLVTSAILFLKKNHKDWLDKKVESYKGAKRTKNNERRNKRLLESIEEVNGVVVDDLWCGKGTIPEAAKEWVELWFMEDDAAPVFSLLEDLQIVHKEQSLSFPERIVVLVCACREDLERVFYASSTFLRVSPVPTLAGFIPMESGKEQTEWQKMMMEQFRYDKIGDKYFCLLDSGVVAGHPMLLPVLSDTDLFVVNPKWGINDVMSHGTRMAGVAIYGDLTDMIATGRWVEPRYRLCSVKVLSNNSNSQKDFWADYTKQGVALAEINHGNDVMGYCMAIAEMNGYTNGVPSSWSSAIDQICMDERGEVRRLFIQCAGNVVDERDYLRYPDSNKTRGVVNPGQAWNALTVGAYTEKITAFDDDGNQMNVVAQEGGLSPYSTTSVSWDAQMPIKPDIVMEGGNRAVTTGGTEGHGDLELLTTGTTHSIDRPFGWLNATSAATALAARYAAMVSADNPGYWPETIRGLFVHTAEWTEQMLNDCQDVEERLRVYGYGVPNLEKMLESRKNGVTFIAQKTIRPYKKGQKGNSFNEMHLFTLPWPKETLLSMGECDVKLSITLSYFIEPGPTDNYISTFKKYNYASSGLRFELSNTNENARQFKNRILHTYDEDEVKVENDTQRWNVGIRRRTRGSIHKDWVELSAADLATCNLIAVFPVSGWWYYRKSLSRIESDLRYSLLITLETGEGVDFSTEIENKIPIANQVEIAAR